MAENNEDLFLLIGQNFLKNKCFINRKDMKTDFLLFLNFRKKAHCPNSSVMSYTVVDHSKPP
jgi:hypothetical protein